MKKALKFINTFSAGISYLLSSLSRKPFISYMPLSAGIELTNYCNLSCPECLSGSGKMKRAKGFMDEALFDKFISEAGPYLHAINLYFQGEPMLHPQFFRFVEKAGTSSVTVSTNGHFLNAENCTRLVRSGVKKLIISLDGMNSETYSQYRVGGDFERVITGIRSLSDELSKFKSSLKLEIQFLVNNSNEHQIPLVKFFAGEVKASLKLKSMQVSDNGDIEKWLPENEKFRRYIKGKNGKFVIKNSFNNNCLRLWMNPVITWDGKVVPCCFDKDAEHIMGDLNDLSFRDIWRGEKYKAFRQSVLKARGEITICRNCTSGLKGVSV